MEAWLLSFFVLAILSIIDVTATLWTINFIKTHKEALRERDLKHVENANSMELSIIPSLLLKLKAPKVVFYLFALSLIFIGMKYSGLAKELFFFMSGAYMVVLQIHWANVCDLKKVK